MKSKFPFISRSKVAKNIYQSPQDFATKWSGAFNVKNPIPADKIRDFINYSDL